MTSLTSESNDLDVEAATLFTVGESEGGYAQVEALVKLHNISRHTRKSDKHNKRFITLAGRNLPQDNITRWNSWFELLRVATVLEVQEAINQYVTEFDELEKDTILKSEWKVLYETKQFLETFAIATKRLQKDSVTIDSALYTMDVIINHLETEKARIC